jgi:kynureninase
MFDEIGMDAIIEKRDKITCYLEYILEEISGD